MLAYIDTPRLKMDLFKKCLRLSMLMGIQSSPEKKDFRHQHLTTVVFSFRNRLDAGHDKMPVAGAVWDMRTPPVVGGWL